MQRLIRSLRAVPVLLVLALSLVEGLALPARAENAVPVAVPDAAGAVAVPRNFLAVPAAHGFSRRQFSGNLLVPSRNQGSLQRRVPALSPAWDRAPSGLLVPNPDASIPERFHAIREATEKSPEKARRRLDAAFDANLYDADGGSGLPPVVPPAPAETGRALLESLHARTGQGYLARGFKASREYMFKTADSVERGGVRGVVDAYSGVFVPGRSDDGNDYPERGDQNGDGVVDREGMNAEHVWPQSFFDSHAPMRSDLHHLLPTFVHPNGVRGHLPFGEVRGKPEYQNSGGAKAGSGVFEPPDASKGRIARALLYFYVRYYDRGIKGGAYASDFWNSRLEMLLRWNREHPPTLEEKTRNDLVQTFQGNRNPFVDDPGLAERIGVDGFRDSPLYRASFKRPQDTRPWSSRSERQYRRR